MPPRLLAALVLLATPVAAAAQSGGTAHLYAYTVKDRAAFEAGYRRHLLWHAGKQDKLAWFAWYVTAGARKGAFVDGTFGTTPEGLAGRPDPDGDGADFRANVSPFVTALGDEGWELVRTASQATLLEDRRPGALLHVYLLHPTGRDSFEAAVRTWKAPGVSLYKSSGDGPVRYLLMMPAQADTAPPPVLPLRADILRAETWAYAPRLALMPGETLSP